MKSFRRLLARVFLSLLFAAAAAAAAQAQSWPTRPITLVVGFAGGIGDAIARPFAEYASKALGQPVLVEARPGGGGIVAAIGISKAAPDGYTLGLQAVGPMILRPIMDPAVGFDADKDFTPIVLFADTPNVVLAGSKSPARSVQELMDWAKKNPGLVTIGHPGPGSMGHLAALLLAADAKVTGTYISYRNVGQMVVDLLGGQIDFGIAAYTPSLKAARILAVMTPEPVKFLPGVPSMREAGFPGVYASTWLGLYGPPKLPPQIVAKLNAVVNAFAHDPEALAKLTPLGFRMPGGSPVDLTKKMAADKAVWAKVISDNNIKLSDVQ